MRKIILAEDQQMMRDIFSTYLRSCQFEVLADATNGFDVLEQMSTFPADVVITDIEMPEMDGIELTRQMKELYPTVPVIGLTMHKDDHLVSDMLQAGAKGYLLKDSDVTQFKEAVSVVLSNGLYLCRESREKLNTLLPETPPPTVGTAIGRLTERELKIIRYSCAHMSNSEIGRKLFISPRTVDNCRSIIYKKLGLKNLYELKEFGNRFILNKK